MNTTQWLTAGSTILCLVDGLWMTWAVLSSPAAAESLLASLAN